MRVLWFVLCLFSVVIASCKHPELDATTKGAAGGCSSLVSADKCDFYTCYSNEFRCQPSEYPLAYGKHYCERFQNLCGGSLTSPKARKWIAGTMKCLQVALAVRRNQLATCDQVSDYAFDSHPNCYTTGSVDYGGVSFCSLNPVEWSRIRSCVNATDRLSVIGLKQIAATALRCNKFFLSGLLLQGDQVTDAPDQETSQMIESMSPPEREARAAEFLDFAHSILKGQ